MAYRPNWFRSSDAAPYGTGWRSWTGLGTIFRLTFACFILEHLVHAVGGEGALRGLFSWFGLRAWTPGGWINPLFPVQLFTYPLLHSLQDWMHIGMNMFFLWMFGKELEATLGKAGFLRLYASAAVGSGLVQWAWGLTSGLAFGSPDAAPTIGASGAVYAVMVLYACRYPRRVIMLLFPPIPIPAVFFVGFRVVLDGLAFLRQLGGAPGDVAVACHLGGALLGFLWFKRGDLLDRWWRSRKRTKAMTEFRKETVDRQEMDRILAKIQTSGLSSLNRTERAYLDQRSRQIREKGR